jgi:hypothetical protein
MQHHVDVPDGLGGEPTVTPPATVFEQVGIEEVELHGSQSLQLDLPEQRNHMGSGVGPVAGPGRGPKLQLDRGQPLVDQEAGDGPLRRLGECAAMLVGDRLSKGRLALLPGLEAALGLLSTPTGQWIGVDVEVPGPGAAAFADAAPHRSSILRRGAVGTRSLRPMRNVWSWPALAAR